MKLSRIILTGVFATAMMGNSFATTSIEDSTQVESKLIEEEQAKEEIDLSALPEAIVKELKKKPYVEWKAQKAYEIKTKEAAYYEVLVSKGGEEMSLFFNEDGTVIEK